MGQEIGLGAPQNGDPALGQEKKYLMFILFVAYTRLY